MKNVFYIFLICAVTFAGLGCSDKDTIIPDQIESFENFINSRDYVTYTNNGVYQCITNADRTGYDTAPVVEYGDIVSFYFTLYRYANNNYQQDSPIYSTSPTVIDAMRETYPEANFEWPSGPSPYVMGQARLVKGLEYGLTNLREGDEALLLVTSDLAYGSDQFGQLPEDSPVVYEVFIHKIIKQ